MSSLLRDFDFDVIREPWNKYGLTDGSYLKTKYVLTRFRKGNPDPLGKQQISFDGQPIIIIYSVPETLRGEPSESP